MPLEKKSVEVLVMHTFGYN